MNEPLVSVIIPCYNVEAYLSQCLESVINQSYKNLQIICVNDGSTDDTQSIIEDFRSKDSRIDTILQKNLGLSAARNSGTGIAIGKYLTYLDSDDYLAIDMIKECVELAELHSLDIVNSLPVAFCDDSSIHDSGIKSININYQNKFDTIRYQDFEEDLEIPKSAWGRLINTAWLKAKDIKFQEGLLYEDIYFWWSIYFEHPKLGLSMKPGYMYRLRSDSIMRQSEDFPRYSKARHHLLNWEKLVERLAHKKQLSKYLTELKRLLSYYGWYTRRYSLKEERQEELDFEQSLLSNLLTKVNKEVTINEDK